MRNILLLFIVSFFLIIFVMPIYAEAPAHIVYQGRLTTDTGIPINGKKQLDIKLYDAKTGGVQLWHERHTAIEFKDGVFSLYLGQGTLQGGTKLKNLAWNQPYFIELTVDNNTFSPRTKLGVSPYAHNAKRLGGVKAGKYDTGVTNEHLVPKSITADSVGVSVGFVYPSGKIQTKSVLACSSGEFLDGKENCVKPTTKLSGSFVNEGDTDLGSNLSWNGSSIDVTQGVASGLNADQIDGYEAGNDTGQIPISNGTTNKGLRADTADHAETAVVSKTSVSDSYLPRHKASSNINMNQKNIQKADTITANKIGADTISSNPNTNDRDIHLETGTNVTFTDKEGDKEYLNIGRSGTPSEAIISEGPDAGKIVFRGKRLKYVTNNNKPFVDFWPGINTVRFCANNPGCDSTKLEFKLEGGPILDGNTGLSHIKSNSAFRISGNDDWALTADTIARDAHDDISIISDINLDGNSITNADTIGVNTVHTNTVQSRNNDVNISYDDALIMKRNGNKISRQTNKQIIYMPDGFRNDLFFKMGCKTSICEFMSIRDGSFGGSTYNNALQIHGENNYVLASDTWVSSGGVDNTVHVGSNMDLMGNSVSNADTIGVNNNVSNITVADEIMTPEEYNNGDPNYGDAQGTLEVWGRNLSFKHQFDARIENRSGGISILPDGQGAYRFRSSNMKFHNGNLNIFDEHIMSSFYDTVPVKSPILATVKNEQNEVGGKIRTGNLQATAGRFQSAIGVGVSPAGDSIAVMGDISISSDQAFKSNGSFAQKYVPEADNLSVSGTNHGLITAKNGLFYTGNANNAGSSTGHVFGFNTDDPGSVNWNEVMRITETGVGVGTGSPESSLHLRNNQNNHITIESTLNSSDETFLSLKKDSRGNSGDQSRISWREPGSGNTSIYASIDMKRTDVTDGSIDGSLQFTTANDDNPSTRMTITNNGNVGIGTSSPRDLLTIQRNVSDEYNPGESKRLPPGPILQIVNHNNNNKGFAGIAFSGQDGVGTRKSFIGGLADPATGGAGPMVFGAGDPNDGSKYVENMRITKDGRVGIGTTSPDSILDIRNESDPSEGSLLLSSNASDDNDHVGLSLTSHGNNEIDLHFGRNYSVDGSFQKFMTMDHNGRLGIGTTSPSVKLDVNGQCRETRGACADVAELYPSATPIAAGHLVAPDDEKKHVRKAENRSSLIGITSTEPAIVFDGDNQMIGGRNDFSDTRPPVALSGRVPVRVNLEGGTIEPGDPITVSSETGIGTKARTAGTIVGVALESYDQQSEKDDILVFVNPRHWEPERPSETVHSLQKKVNELTDRIQKLEQQTNGEQKP